MSAHFAKDQVSFVTPAELSPRAFAPSTSGGFTSALRGAAAWLAGAFQRRAVINELSMLSDHELADIGLTRADIGRVFDPALNTSRATPRA
jgi:uncharacterized protein YjiS (DUF1127 family)